MKTKSFLLQIFTISIFNGTTAQTHLSLHQTFSCEVFANKMNNSCNIFLDAGKTYKFTVSTNDTWMDDYIETDAEGFASSRGKDEISRNILRTAEGLRRIPDANWFCLVGYTLYFQPILGQFSFKIGNTKTLTIPDKKGGILFLFANDVSTMYWNNHGKINVLVKRID